MDFSDKVIIVTGASSGIGAAAAVHLAEQGGLLTIVGRNVENLQETANKIQKIRDQLPLVVKADMNNEQDVKNIVDETLKNMEKLMYWLIMLVSWKEVQ